MTVTNPKLEFWNSRADRGATAGTDDFILKRLEIALILDNVPAGAHVLDVGCGNGATLVRLAREKRCSGVGIDFAERMVAAAEEAARAADCRDRLRFEVGSVPGLRSELGSFDYALTERCLINLDGELSQRAAFRDIISHLRPGGLYLMLESSREGLERSNALRRMLDLDAIEPPWHNVFVSESAVERWADETVELVEIIPYSSTYHLLSRVVYAKLARDRNEPLKYDSDINLLSLRLPIIGNLGPARLWRWRRR